MVVEPIEELIARAHVPAYDGVRRQRFPPRGGQLGEDLVHSGIVGINSDSGFGAADGETMCGQFPGHRVRQPADLIEGYGGAEPKSSEREIVSDVVDDQPSVRIAERCGIDSLTTQA